MTRRRSWSWQDYQREFGRQADPDGGPLACQDRPKPAAERDLPPPVPPPAAPAPDAAVVELVVRIDRALYERLVKRAAVENARPQELAARYVASGLGVYWR